MVRETTNGPRRGRAQVGRMRENRRRRREKRPHRRRRGDVEAIQPRGARTGDTASGAILAEGMFIVIHLFDSKVGANFVESTDESRRSEDRLFRSRVTLTANKIKVATEESRE